MTKSKLLNNLKLVYGSNSAQVLNWLLEKLLRSPATPFLCDEELSCLTGEQRSQLIEWVRQISVEHKPVQYILGSVPFLGIEILVEPPILIPRLETEWWVNLLTERLSLFKDKALRILDLCSGSGCIGISLAHFFVESQVMAVDISPVACELIKKNLMHNHLSNVLVRQADLYEAVLDSKFDLIVANPPYVPRAEFLQLDPTVISWEDPQALVAPGHDLSIISKIIELAPLYLQNKEGLDSQLWIEVDFTQAAAVSAMMESYFGKVEVIKDQFGRERVVVGLL